MTPLAAGTPIKTPSGRRGEIVVPSGNRDLPSHALVRLPSGDRQWILAEILIAISPRSVDQIDPY
jgi:hypothetical protein